HRPRRRGAERACLGDDQGRQLACHPRSRNRLECRRRFLRLHHQARAVSRAAQRCRRLSGNAFGHDLPPHFSSKERPMAQTVKFLSPQFLSASTLIGADVKNPQDESLGELKDVMVSTTSGKIAFGVLSFGGMLGMGNKLFAVPWEAFRVDGGNERVVLDVPKERLKDAPGFDKDHWPNFADPTVATQVQTYYQR